MNEPGKPILAYDDLLTDETALIRREPGFVRIVTPQMRSLRTVGKGFLISGGLIAFGLSTAALVAIREHQFSLEFLPPMGIYGAILLLIFAFAWTRYRTHYVFEVTRDLLTVRRFAGKSERSSTSYRRDLVRHVSKVLDSKRLNISITGHDLVELFISTDNATLTQIAEALDAAVKKDVDAVDPTLPPWVSNADRAAMDGSRNRLLLIMVTIAGTSAIGITFVLGPFAGVMLFLLILLPIGVFMGSQKKDFWL